MIIRILEIIMGFLSLNFFILLIALVVVCAGRGQHHD